MHPYAEISLRLSPFCPITIWATAHAIIHSVASGIINTVDAVVNVKTVAVLSHPTRSWKFGTVKTRTGRKFSELVQCKAEDVFSFTCRPSILPVNCSQICLTWRSSHSAQPLNSHFPVQTTAAFYCSSKNAHNRYTTIALKFKKTLASFVPTTLAHKRKPSIPVARDSFNVIANGIWHIHV